MTEETIHENSHYRVLLLEVPLIIQDIPHPYAVMNLVTGAKEFYSEGLPNALATAEKWAEILREDWWKNPEDQGVDRAPVFTLVEDDTEH